MISKVNSIWTKDRQPIYIMNKESLDGAAKWKYSASTIVIALKKSIRSSKIMPKDFPINVTAEISEFFMTSLRKTYPRPLFTNKEYEIAFAILAERSHEDKWMIAHYIRRYLDFVKSLKKRRSLYAKGRRKAQDLLWFLHRLENMSESRYSKTMREGHKDLDEL